MRVLALLVFLGCGVPPTSPEPQGSSGDEGEDVDGGVTDNEMTTGDGGADAQLTACEEAVFHSDYAWIQAKVWTASCTASVCHGGTNPDAGLDLTAGTSYAKLVNVQSSINTTWLRVAPGDPAASILMVRLGGEPGPTVNRMPLSQPALCVEKIDAVRRWILSGAPNN